MLIDQIDRIISMYQWTVGIFISIILAAVGFFGYIQWKLKKEQEIKIKNEIFSVFSKDISEVLSPLIANSLSLMAKADASEYLYKIKQLKQYIELDKKYSFDQETKKTIYLFRYSIVRDFGELFARLTDLQLADLDEQMRSLFSLNNITPENKFPEIEEVECILKLIVSRKSGVGILFHTDPDELLDNYKKFYNDFRDA